MAAENKTDEPSFSQATAEGHEYSSSASQVNSCILLTGASVDQIRVTSCPQTPVVGASSFRILPTVHVTRHPYTVCMANSMSSTRSSSAYAHPMTPMSPGDKQGNGSVFISPVQQQQNVVTRTVPTVHQAAQPAAVLDLGNNGILNAVLGRLPNVGTMVVHSLDPVSVIQKNLVAMIDSGTSAVTTAAAVPVINLQPVLTLSYQGTMALQPPRQASSQITHHVLQASGLQRSLQQIGSREPLVACSLPAKQHVAFSQSSVGAINTCSQQPPSLNPAFMRHTVMVRTTANSSGHTQLSFSVSPANSPRFQLVNSAEMIPRIKHPHTTSSLPGAIVRYHTTTTAQVMQQSSALVASHSASQIQPNISSGSQAQLIAAGASFVTNISRSALTGSSTNIMSAPSTVPPSESESLTTIIPAQSMIPFDIQQSDVIAKSATDYVGTAYSLPTHSPLVADSAGICAIPVCHTGVSTSAAHLATSSNQILTCTNIVCNSKNSTPSMFSTHQTFASYVPASVPALPVRRFAVPTSRLRQGQVRCSSETVKRSVKRPPRQKTATFICPVSGHETNVYPAKMLKQVFHSSAVGMPTAGSIKSVSPVLVDSLSHAAAPRANTGALIAGVKRKCTRGEKYTLLLESGCKYSSVCFDGEGFRAKTPTISAALTGSTITTC